MRKTAFLLNKLAKLDKADGFMINFLKILFRILTFLYGYYSVGSLVGLLKNWLNPSELYLPSSVNPWKLWLLYTAAYLMLCAIHTILLKLIRFVKKRDKKTVAK